MFLDPKKSYPSIRVRLVDYKTKDMVDISLPSEYFDDDEIKIIKDALFHALDSADTVVNAINNRVVNNDKEAALAEAELSDDEIEKSVFSEEEKDGEE